MTDPPPNAVYIIVRISSLCLKEASNYHLKCCAYVRPCLPTYCTNCINFYIKQYNVADSSKCLILAAKSDLKYYCLYKKLRYYDLYDNLTRIATTVCNSRYDYQIKATIFFWIAL